MEVDSFHAQGQQMAGDEVNALFEYVQKMPEGPQKAHFMKRVSRIVWMVPSSHLVCGCLKFEGYKAPGTPSQDVKHKRFHRNKV